MSPFASDALAGRSVLITGASSGLGRATAVAIAAHGGRVIASGRDQARLDQTLGLLAGEGHSAIATALDDADQATALVVEASARAGGLDGVFHSAGAELVLPVRLVKQKHLDQVLGAALLGAIGISRATAKADVMKPHGSVVLMSSAAAHRGKQGMSVYSAAKAAIEGLTRSMACELAPKTVRVNAVAAGVIETEMHHRWTSTLTAGALAEHERQHLLGFGIPDDVADAALFLLSPASRWITGTVLVVDGGYLAS